MQGWVGPVGEREEKIQEVTLLIKVLLVAKLLFLLGNTYVATNLLGSEILFVAIKIFYIILVIKQMKNIMQMFC